MIRAAVVCHRNFFRFELLELILFVNRGNSNIGFSVENIQVFYFALLRIDFDQIIAQQYCFVFIMCTTLAIHTNLLYDCVIHFFLR